VDFGRARQVLVDSLSYEIKDERVLRAFATVPRELFVPENIRHLAYDDRPLSIGYGQTISQPYIVAVMTNALELTGVEDVLEIGTGSGYQTAILSQLAKTVYSVERITELAEAARHLLNQLGCRNVTIKIAGDELGWPEHAPYDAIMVTAGAPSLPEALVKQLRVGGKMVIPVGTRWEQELLKVIRGQHGNEVINLGGCRFVPLLGKDAWEE